jgi:hypothetical protein
MGDINMKQPEFTEWIDLALNRSQPVILTDHEEKLADSLIDKAYELSAQNDKMLGKALAAAFDILVSAEYYKRVTNRGWCYCPNGEPSIIYPYTNTCPRCILNKEFHYHPANKPPSGQIGQATSRLLCVFLDRLFNRSSKSLKILKGSEPIDMIIQDNTSNVILIAEVKAAPLLTLPLFVKSERMTAVKGDAIIELQHSGVDNSSIHSSEFNIMLPVQRGESWNYELIPLGRMENTPELWVYDRLQIAFQTDNDLFKRYFHFWDKAIEAYQSAYTTGDRTSSIYWLTNACGQPSPRPENWPLRSNGSGYESVSDAKTSVGMDRTDDIKKGIYQVLKLGAESKPLNRKYNVKTALISNIHAVRHYDEYLLSLQDVVWTLDENGTAKKVGDLPDERPIYNLFDGIISFTRNVARDEWIRDVFKF